jgi:type III secretory pathway component EscV
VSDVGRCGTCVLLSFSRAHGHAARQVARDLRAAGLSVRCDAWEGGGGLLERRLIETGLDGVVAVIVLLTPSDVAPTWIGPVWLRTVHDPARERGIAILPVRLAGSLDAVPQALRGLSHADLSGVDRPAEFVRLLRTLQDRIGHVAVRILGDDVAASALDDDREPIPPLVIELGTALAALASDGPDTAGLHRRLGPVMRDGLFHELGVAFPSPHLRVEPDLPADQVRLLIYGIPEQLFDVRQGAVLVNGAVRDLQARGYEAEPANYPLLGEDCAWVGSEHVAKLQAGGFTTWDAGGAIFLALGALLRRRASSFLGGAEARQLLDRLRPLHPTLVDEAVPGTLSLHTLADVLRRLVGEGVSVRNLRRVLLSLIDRGRMDTDPLMLAEYVRCDLWREISHRLTGGTGDLPVFLLDNTIEAEIESARRFIATGSYVDLEPERLRALESAIGQAVAPVPANVRMPVIVTAMGVRPFVRRLVAPSMPRLHVIAWEQLNPELNVQPVGRITFGGFIGGPGVGTADGIAIWG